MKTASPDSYSQRLDCIFKRDDLRGVVPGQFDHILAGQAAVAFAQLAASRGNRIVVGCDARESSDALKHSICRSLLAAAVSVDDLGLCSSEEIYYACGSHADRYAGGIMVTASHNPREYNGMKFLFSGAEPLDAAAMAQLRRRMTALNSGEKAAASSNGGIQPQLRSLSLRAEWSEALLDRAGMERLPRLDAKLKVVIAAGNGVGAVAFRPIAQWLEGHGFEFIYLDEQPDGAFPHGVPNPLLPEYMQRLGNAVRENRADLGIGFDGDADRAGFTDETGREIIPANVYALVTQCKLAASRQSADAVPPVLMRNICCSQLIPALFGKSCEVVDTPVGHGQIKLLMRHPRYCRRVVFAGEHSGHYFYPEFFSIDSGCLTALYMLKALSQAASCGNTLSRQLGKWRDGYAWSGEINFELPDRQTMFDRMRRIWELWRAKPGTVAQTVQTDPDTGLQMPAVLAGDYHPETLRFPDLKIICDHGGSGWWLVVRPSGNEPKLRLNLEAWGPGCAGLCRELTDEIRGIMEGRPLHRR